MRTTMSRSSWVGCVLGGVFLSTCLTGTGYARTIQGQVLEAETGKPIAGAVVLGVWTKSVGLLLSHWELLGVREAETDAEGRFVLEQLGGLFVQERITVYKFGYIAWSNRFIFDGPSGNRATHEVPPEIRLDHFPVGGSHKRHMEFIDLATSSGLSYDAWAKFRETIRQEERLR
jgi:hypothetical protein